MAASSGSKKRSERRIEDKFGVSTSYPQLSLHSAAANGNVGLVKYALSNGQPASSILNGVLPIHAACSNGNEAIVRMLIENGADVNAPRLPRRYSNDRRADGISVGTSGSTPLHFAAANGHAGIVELLLACGARPDLTEKHGHTPATVARSHGHEDVLKVLDGWIPPEGERIGTPNSLTPLASPNSATANSDARSILSNNSSSLSSKIKNKVAKRKTSNQSLKQSASSGADPAATYSALTLQPNHSSTTLNFLDKRRPSLSAVLDRAAYQGAVLKQALGMNSSLNNLQLPPRPAPLTLIESNSDAFEEGPGRLSRRQSSASTRSARSPFASIFNRKRGSPSASQSSIPSSPSSQISGLPGNDMDSFSGDIPEDSEVPPSAHTHSSRRYVSEDGIISPTSPSSIASSSDTFTNFRSSSDRTYKGSSSPLKRASTAPHNRTTFSLPPPPPPPLPLPSVYIDSTHSLEGKRTASYNNLGSQYRPRKSSGLLTAPPALAPDTSDTASTTTVESEVFHDAQEDADAFDDTSPVKDDPPDAISTSASRPKLTSLRHDQSNSSFSSDRTQTGVQTPTTTSHRRRSPRQSPESSILQRSPPIQEEESMPNPTGDKDEAAEPFRPAKEDSLRAESFQSDARQRQDEAADTVTNEMPSLPAYRSRSHSGTGMVIGSANRLRTNSVGSSGSAASRYSALSPYAVMAPSPLASNNNSSERLQLSPNNRQGPQSEWEFPPFVSRPRRSGSTSTEPDLRHMVLSSHSSNNGGEGPGSSVAGGAVSSSPTSSSSWGSFRRPSSAHSTSATSFVPSSASIRDPPASPRKFGSPAIITPLMAHSMVVQAEKQLMAYNKDDSASKPSLSDQLAAYSDSLSLEREIVANTIQQQGRPRYIELPPGTHRPYRYEVLDAAAGTRTPLAMPGISSGKPTGVKAYPYKSKASFQQGQLDVRRGPLPTLRQDKSLGQHKMSSSHSTLSLVDSRSIASTSSNKPVSMMHSHRHLHHPKPSGNTPRSSIASTSTISGDDTSKSDISGTTPPPSIALDVAKRKTPLHAHHKHARSSPKLSVDDESVFQLTTPLAPRTSGYDSASGVDGLGISSTSRGSNGKGPSRFARAIGNMKKNVV